MHDETSAPIPLQDGNPSQIILRKLNKYGRFLLTTIFFAAYALVMLRLWWPINLPGKVNGPAAVLLVATLACTVAALTRHLPLQNVLGAAAVIILGSGMAEWLNVETGIPFGPINFGAVGPKFHSLPWALPIIWTVAILNSRGVARLILRPWRKTKNYGVRLISLTIALAVFFDFTFEPYATRVKHYWFWEPTRFPLTWQGAPLINFLSWAVVALLILAFVTPMLINKQLSKRRPPDLHPLIIWLATILLFAVGSAIQGMWIVVAVDAAIGIVAATFAIRGAKW